MISVKPESGPPPSVRPLGIERQDRADAPLIVVGGTGGSGTRAVAHYLSTAGIFMGYCLNRSMDSLPFAEVLDQYTEEWLTFRNDNASGFDRAGFVSLWQDRSREHLFGHDPQMPWGTKNPRTILILDLMYQTFQHMRFLHIVRDGLEMAYSSNQRQLELHGEAIIGLANPGETPPERSLRLWAFVNDQASQLGESKPGRYTRVRYEDFCVDPVQEMRRAGDELSLALKHEKVRRSDYKGSIRKISPDETAAILPLNPSVARIRSRLGYPAI